MTRYGHFLRLLTLIPLVFAGLLLTAMMTLVIGLVSGMSIQEVLEMSQSGLMTFTPGQTRALLLAQHIFTFIIPALVFGAIFYRPRFIEGLDLAKSPGGLLVLLGILFLIAAYPLVNLSFMVNETFPLPTWALSFEDQARETLEAILEMPTPFIFLLNLLIIAILPGIGEELLFRGILQKQIDGIVRSPIAAIWIAAFIFSAIHLQFEGFLPRMILGVVLGYLYHWTRNLWVPIIVHACNNGIQVMLIYFTDMEVSEVDEKTGQLEVWMIPLSVGAMYLIARSIQKRKQLG